MHGSTPRVATVYILRPPSLRPSEPYSLSIMCRHLGVKMQIPHQRMGDIWEEHALIFVKIIPPHPNRGGRSAHLKVLFVRQSEYSHTVIQARPCLSSPFHSIDLWQRASRCDDLAHPRTYARRTGITGRERGYVGDPLYEDDPTFFPEEGSFPTWISAVDGLLPFVRNQPHASQVKDKL